MRDSQIKLVGITLVLVGFALEVYGWWQVVFVEATVLAFVAIFAGVILGFIAVTMTPRGGRNA
ncbi:MAG: hypothetical protein KF784_03335 [Fimbriimonadaceae bacterium]|nr:hypothetical protein [Fimbriimonadaceae bacterium]